SGEYDHHFTGDISRSSRYVLSQSTGTKYQPAHQRSRPRLEYHLFRQDVRQQYNVVRVTATLYTRAGDLCRLHRLRAYDAVQLACALAVRNKLASLGIQALTFVSADTELLAIASAEGLN